MPVALNSAPTLKQNVIPFMQNCDFQPLTPIPFPFLLTSWFLFFDAIDEEKFMLFLESSQLDPLSFGLSSNFFVFVNDTKEPEFCNDKSCSFSESRSGSSTIFICLSVAVSALIIKINLRY